MLLSASSTPSLFHSRRLLLRTTLHSSAAAAAAAPPPEPHNGEKTFDSNIVMVLSFLLCALICAFGLNLIIRCALRCTSRRGVDSIDDAATRLANKGVKRKVLNTFSVITYSESSNQAGLDTECSICISEFIIGERVRVLPKCNHRFHLKCIDKWLVSHSSCPTCRHCLLEKCQKIVGCSEASSSNSSPAPPEVSIIMPLEPEGVVCSNRSFWMWVAHKPIAR